MKLEAKILDLVAKSTPTSTGLIWSDLGGTKRYAFESVKRAVRKLVDDGRLVATEPGGVELSDTERKERALDARVKTRR